MKNKKTLLSIVLVFAVLMGGAYVLYDRLGRNVGTEQMIVHTDQQPAASAATEGDSADPAGEDEAASEQEPEVVPAPDFTVYDKAGNVWQWTNDWYGTYSTTAATDPSGPSSGTGRVIRGGSWSSGASSLRSANRGYYSPDLRYYFSGFRSVRPGS